MKTAWRLFALSVICTLALQCWFFGRVAAMRWIDPESTAFQRSEAWRALRRQPDGGWRQRWVASAQIAPALKRAVIASEDAGFVAHSGVDWAALEKAWQRNRKAPARPVVPGPRTAPPHADGAARSEPSLVGGSTITQQLAKNLFLSGERRLPRKAQELVITFMLEALLPKERILEIYLNSVEWGDGVFGAEAAAQHYFHVHASGLSALQAARLAVMLPAPKRFEQRPDSRYVQGRAATVAARMGAVSVP